MQNGWHLRKIYQVGYCVAIGKLAQKSLSWKPTRFYARSFLFEHPSHGLILVDTGYGEPFLEATQRSWGGLYRRILPVYFSPEESLLSQLGKDGIKKRDLSFLLVSHFHPDHIGALPEFGDVPWLYRRGVLENLSMLSPFQQFRNGFFKTLIPSIPKGSIGIEEGDFNGEFGNLSFCDPFGDRSFLLIDLPGHALGQMGVVAGNVFFVADAQWDNQSLPHLLGRAAQRDPISYRNTFLAIRNLSEGLQIIPSHTMEEHA